MDVEIYFKMTVDQPKKFYKECTWWKFYAIVSCISVCITAYIANSQGHTDWQIFIKSCISLGIATCVVWWLWVMKKLSDIAHWWMEFQKNVDVANKLLVDTKADLSELKEIARKL